MTTEEPDPDDIDALKAALVAERAARQQAEARASGAEAMVAHLKLMIAKVRKLKDRAASVVQLAPDAGLASCHAVLIGAVDRKQLDALLARTAGRPVLTIADTPGAASAGVIINFYAEDDHVKYEINVRAADDSGLVLRAKLLKLARIVGERRGGG